MNDINYRNIEILNNSINDIIYIYIYIYNFNKSLYNKISWLYIRRNKKLY